MNEALIKQLLEVDVFQPATNADMEQRKKDRVELMKKSTIGPDLLNMLKNEAWEYYGQTNTIPDEDDMADFITVRLVDLKDVTYNEARQIVYNFFLEPDY
jgi:hypothetical protein